jgi:hypothetical protein
MNMTHGLPPVAATTGLEAGAFSVLEAWDDTAQQRADTMDAAESYFECITTCSLEDGDCVTRCVELLREA